MTPYKAMETLVQGFFGLGFMCIIVGYLVDTWSQNFSAAAMMTDDSGGMIWSLLGTQMVDFIRYAASAMPVIGLIFLFLSVLIWLANTTTF